MGDELLFHLKYGSGPWNVWRRENPDVPIALDGAKLDGLILTGIDFSGASLRGASLHATNLMNANLRDADLTGANLSEADLIGATLEGATLTGASLHECDLLGADLTNARCSGDDLALIARPIMRDDAPVDVVPYDACWPDKFDAERELLLIAIGMWLTGPVEHIGSTAVPGLSAKPTIDIMAGIESFEASRAALPILETYEYRYAPYRTDVMHWFCKPSPAVRTYHLHLVPFRSRLWLDQLAFRDYLRAHTEVAEAYASLKRRLAAQHRFDREAYTEAKVPFVRRVLERTGE